MTGDMEDLRRLVDEYGIRWSASPERAVLDGAVQPIGFNVELSATHGHAVDPAHPATPGCPQCGPVLEALHAVAEYALPKEQRDSFYEVHLSRAHVFSGGDGDPPRMTARLTILHSGDPSRPPDACEARCREEIIAKLKLLGAREGG
jgi:hypothetical protein